MPQSLFLPEPIPRFGLIASPVRVQNLSSPKGLECRLSPIAEIALAW
jgi:hypothetical protein